MVQYCQLHMSLMYPGALFCNFAVCVISRILKDFFHLDCSGDLQVNDLIQIQSLGSKGWKFSSNGKVWVRTLCFHSLQSCWCKVVRYDDISLLSRLSEWRSKPFKLLGVGGNQTVV